MAGATFYNMKLLCYTDDADFTDYQGIGSDPMYRRFDSVYSVVRNHIDPPYQGLLARPHYDDGIINWYVQEWQEPPVSFSKLTGADKEKYAAIKEETLSHYRLKMQQMNPEEIAILSGALKYIDDDLIYCYDNKIVLVAWGMRPDTTKHKIAGSWVKELKIEEKYKVVFDCGTNGKFKKATGKVIYRKKGYQLQEKDIPEIIAGENYEFVRWEPDPVNFKVNADALFTAQYKKLATETPIEQSSANVVFDAGTQGTLVGESNFTCPVGHLLTQSEIPEILPHEGYKFSHWTPSVSLPINGDTLYVAEYEPLYCTCTFEAGAHGTIVGQDRITKSFGSPILSTDMPQVRPHEGYRFVGWNISPLGALKEDKTVTAQYKQELILPKKAKPQEKNNWRKWLLWLLLALLFTLLMFFLQRGCTPNYVGILPDRPENSKVKEDPGKKERDPGEKGKDDGAAKKITDDKGNLPDSSVVAPIKGENGEDPEIIHNEGVPDVIGNRLNIYFEDENADLDKWAHDFKQAYPSDEYNIIGCDRKVKMIQIQMPGSQREQVKSEINRKIPDQEFFVVDESVVTPQGEVSSRQNKKNKGWHIKATNLQQAWKITKGSPEVVVAVVDDGIDPDHPMLKGRIDNPYNIFTQNSTLSVGKGHGTHVASLVAGSDEYINNGASGVAPNCKIMPIQVFDGDICTLSSIASGIMYAIHQGADVVNISLGLPFKGLNTLPLDEQKKIAKTYFKNEERVYRHLIQTANKKNVILVFSAGNDDVLTAISPSCRYAGHTINVSAIAPDYSAADFTNYSEGTNISAPGVNIYGAYLNKSFEMLDGTSMAAPIAAGTVALMKSIRPDLTVEQAIAVLQNTGKPIDRYLPNMLLIDRALEMVKKGNYTGRPISGVGQDPMNPVADPGAGKDDYDALKRRIEQLKTQRDQLDKQINNLEKELK